MNEVYNRNPNGKGLNTRYDLDEEGLTLAQQVMKFNLLIMNTFEGKAETREELADRFTTYFEMCLEHGRIPTVERTCSCFWFFKKPLL